MGNACCVSRKAPKKIQSQPNTPKLEFNLKYWANSHHVNFRDPSSVVSKQFQVKLNDGQSKFFPLTDYKIKDVEGKQKELGCTVKRLDSVYSIQFDVKQIWRFANDWIQLDERDTYNIGNTSYRLSRFVRGNNYKEDEASAVSAVSASAVSIKLSKQESRMSIQGANSCRICMSSKQREGDPLISPCKCTGSIQFLHLKCLSRWLFGDIAARTNFISLQTQRAVCQLCKTNISDSEAYGKAIASVLSGQHDIAPPFIIIEGRMRNRQGENLKNYMILSFAEKKKLTIGRSKQADIVDKADPFVSRINSVISEMDDKVYVKDHESKHGTGVLLQNPIVLSSHHNSYNIIFLNVHLQINYKDTK